MSQMRHMRNGATLSSLGGQPGNRWSRALSKRAYQGTEAAIDTFVLEPMEGGHIA